MKPNIIIADDHFLFRDGLKTMFEVDNVANILAEASNGQELLMLLEQYQPDVILMDIDMPVMDGIEATSKVLDKYPEMKILVLTMFSDEQYYSQMIECGAKGFILKTANKNELENALLKVYKGQTYFSNEILQRLVANLSLKQKGEKQSFPDFSDKEIEIIKYLADGYSTTEISDKIFLSPKTIENYRTKLLSKTGCKNSTSLVVYAIKNKLIEI